MSRPISSTRYSCGTFRESSCAGQREPSAVSSETPSQSTGTGSSSSTTSSRTYGEGLATTAAPRGVAARAGSSASAARSRPSCSASAKRTRTCADTASAEHPQIESCAEFSITRRHASARNSSGHSPPCSAASGSAYRSSHRSARAAAALMSIRADVTFIRTLARAPDRISPVQVVGGGRAVRQRRAERRELDPDAVVLRVRALDDVDELRERLLVIGAVHREHRVVAEERPHRLDQRVDGAAEVVGRQQEVRGVAVAGREVLRANRRAVDSAPLEHVSFDRGGDTAPDDGVVEPVRAQDLRHLRDVPEHVGQVADAHLAAELARALEPDARGSARSSRPETRNSSISTCHGPIASRPSSTSARSRCSFSGLISR